MSLRGTAQETLLIIENGGYTNPSGDWVDIGKQVRDAIYNTVLYEPRKLKALLRECSTGNPPTYEVTTERSQVAARRLVKQNLDPVVLNFASARNPGGGFINGAKAQEEDLCRCSALYPCLEPQREYYDANRNSKSVLYTDHIIYSQDVPFFRENSHELCDEAIIAGVITAPAPNAGQAHRRKGFSEDELEETLRRRAGMVLGVARANGHQSVVLGAWGCGVFGNDPETVANIFGEWLEGPVFSGAFQHVCFPVLVKSARDQNNFDAFQARFGQ